jgi:hypothetical protein
MNMRSLAIAYQPTANSRTSAKCIHPLIAFVFTPALKFRHIFDVFTAFCFVQVLQGTVFSLPVYLRSPSAIISTVTPNHITSSSSSHCCFCGQRSSFAAALSR